MQTRALWSYCRVEQPDWSNLVGRHAWQIFTAFPASVACVHFHTHPAASSNCIPHAKSVIGVPLPPLALRGLVKWKRACKWYKSQDSRRQVPWQLFRVQTAAALASYSVTAYISMYLYYICICPVFPQRPSFQDLPACSLDFLLCVLSEILSLCLHSCCAWPCFKVHLSFF